MGAEMKNNLLRVILECHEILTLLSSLSLRPVYLAQSSPYFLHKGKCSVDTAVQLVRIYQVKIAPVELCCT